MIRWIPTTAVIFLFLGCSPKKQEKQSEFPNIIYVLADDLGYGDLSVYNPNSPIRTPNLDRLAANGIRFTDAHTSASVCTPTRYGILTGRYNWRSSLKSGVLTGKSKALIPPDRTTVASMLKTKGYQTAFIGKWHLGWDWALNNPDDTSGEGWDARDFDNLDFSKPIQNGPESLGFDYSFGHSGSLDMAPYVYVENGMPTQIPTKSTINTGDFTWWREGPTADDFIHEDVTPNFFRKAGTYLKQRAKTKEPFLLYLALPSPHTPILPTAEWQGKSGLNPYTDFVMMVDDYFGKLMTQLSDLGLDQNTLIIFTSDNGCSPEADFEDLIAKGHNPSHIYRGHKADIFEGGHRVPFIVQWKGEINPGSVSDQVICTTDLMATLAEITAFKLADNEGEDSVSLLPVLLNPEREDPIREATVHHSINGSFALRKGDWKLILTPDSGGWSNPKPENTEATDRLPKFQLYNIQLDPGETQNVVSAHPEIVTELKELLAGYIKNGRSTPGVPQKNDNSTGDWHQLNFLDP